MHTLRNIAFIVGSITLVIFTLIVSVLGLWYTVARKWHDWDDSKFASAVVIYTVPPFLIATLCYAFAFIEIKKLPNGRVNIGLYKHN